MTEQTPLMPPSPPAGPPLPPVKKPMNKNKLALILVIVIVIAIIVAIANAASNNDSKSETKTTISTEKKQETSTTKPSTTTQTTQPTQTTTPAPAPQTFSGIGDSAVPAFNLNKGLAIFEMSHNGGANFAIQLYSSTGGYVDLLVNTIGTFNGSKVISLDHTGQYTMNVTASGNWSAKVSQPTPISVGSPPISFSQGIRFATPFFTLKSGIATFKMTHNGSANFAVILYDSYGNNIDLLANEIGPYSGSQVVPVQSGTYILDVEANGTWSIDITQ